MDVWWTLDVLLMAGALFSLWFELFVLQEKVTGQKLLLWRWVTKQLAGAAEAVGLLKELGFILICELDCKEGLAASLGDVSWL